jgi:hypothetical protein
MFCSCSTHNCRQEISDCKTHPAAHESNDREWRTTQQATVLSVLGPTNEHWIECVKAETTDNIVRTEPAVVNVMMKMMKKAILETRDRRWAGVVWTDVASRDRDQYDEMECYWCDCSGCLYHVIESVKNWKTIAADARDLQWEYLHDQVVVMTCHSCIDVHLI